MKNTFLKFSVACLAILTFVACDKDYNTLGADILTDQGFTTSSYKFPALAYSKKLNPVRSSNINSALLGVYKDPVYGLTTSHIVTQVTPASFNPNFGTEPVLDSVVLNVPYFSTKTGETDENGNSLYKLDSLFGSNPIKLSIYQNTYFLRDLDPTTNLEEVQLYYSNANQTINFNNFTGQLFYENEEFYPSSKEILILEEDEETGEEEVVERKQPALRVNLAETDALKTFWENLFFGNQDNPELSNANLFKEFFRGLYFKTEALNDDGHMLMLNFTNSGANFTVYYHTVTTLTDEDGNETEQINTYEYPVNLVGNKVNLIENNFNFTLPDGDETLGDETLYLKGTEGSMAVVKLFDGTYIDTEGVEHEAYEYFTNAFKNSDGSPKKLVNEANLIFYVNQNIVNGQEPERVMLYDLKNNIPVADYYFDLQNVNDPNNSKLNFSRPLERDEDENGIRYKLRITEHINNILLRDSTNVDLGLVVSTNINVIDRLKIADSDQEPVTTVPLCQFLSPRGTVLYGNTSNVPEDKRIAFEIFFSEPKE
ncbi:MAG TPA: DUF4270 domain-containing protein [Flavobacteriaceae bacterium]|nr:DUF4270 domain-containing protein [Flavobacteriaceae bacterium]